jgi:signal transduction histidine kinase
VVEVWRDISDRRAAEARLAESHRLASLGLLASGFSHELNTPLATVLMSVEGILRDARDGQLQPAEVSTQATVAREQILRCRAITQQFLRMSRGQASAVDVVDARAAVTAVARLVAPTARDHSVTIEVKDGTGDARVRADEGQLQQAIFNLLLNGVQASPPGGDVTVVVTGRDEVNIRIADRGPGIAPEHQKRVFEPFFSIRPGGTGLGLFLSLNFVRAWGGDIRLQSIPNLEHGLQICRALLEFGLQLGDPAA